MIGLEHKADLAIAKPRQLRARHQRQVAAVEADRPGAGKVQPAQQMQQRALACARCAAHGLEIPVANRQVYLAQHFQRPFAQEIRLP